MSLVRFACAVSRSWYGFGLIRCFYVDRPGVLDIPMLSSLCSEGFSVVPPESIGEAGSRALRPAFCGARSVRLRLAEPGTREERSFPLLF